MTAADKPQPAPTALTVGDPAGIGPDLCLDILSREEFAAPLVVIGDRDVLAARAALRGKSFAADDYDGGVARRAVLHCPADAKVECGTLSPENAGHVLAQLRLAAEGCAAGRFSAMSTAPVSKQTIHAAGFDFCGQTEYIAALVGAQNPVMLLAGETMRIALATHHLPLSQVVAQIRADRLVAILRVLAAGLRKYFTDGRNPRIAVAGLNPHAGEGGMMGDEETREIIPAIARAAAEGMDATGPFPADTMLRAAAADCYLAMYHDQGLPLIKYAEFDSAVNCTLGLPFLRTSPDHGTAAALAGTRRISPYSMRAAVRLAMRAAAIPAA